MAGLPQQPSAAAAAGAAAAALLQRQLAQDIEDAKPDKGWSEHQTGDGRKFYFHEETQTSTWEKPDVMKTVEERITDPMWKEYKIWDGRVFYHNKDTKVSCWAMPPELRRLRGQESGVDERPIPPTSAERVRAFWDLMKDKGVDEGWNWRAADAATSGAEEAQGLEEALRKQSFAEVLSQSMSQKHIAEREKERNAAQALERLIEERFPRPEDLETTYEEATTVLRHEEAWGLISSDVRRDEVFQAVMERLEEKHQKARAEQRPERIVRLQRMMGSDPELKRTRLRWKDAREILERRGELQEEEPPLEALRLWASLRALKTSDEHAALLKPRSLDDEAVYRAERKRRDGFVKLARGMVVEGEATTETPFAALQGAADGDPSLTALRDSAGAAAMELYDEVLAELAEKGAEAFRAEHAADAAAWVQAKASKEERESAEATAEPQAKRRKRGGFDEVDAQPAAAMPEEPGDDTNPLDELIKNLPDRPKEDDEKKEDSEASEAKSEAEVEEDEDEDPLMGAANKAAEARAEREAASVAAPVASAPARVKQSEGELMAKKAEELKAMCRARGLPVSGTKAVLVERLLA
ncbi:unnamed protein product [Prorocentrum cordatum]|uniref:Uncharacterized protein n=1 Tax=Prorocentrum cordatum TaxID=2364126 RepID=A0ABN9U8E9_9DINO|nr:unnamed protein product [Polarella glacialis]